MMVSTLSRPRPRRSPWRGRSPRITRLRAGATMPLMALIMIASGTAGGGRSALAECTDFAEQLYCTAGISFEDWAEGVATSGTLAFVVGDARGLQVVDLTDPSSPQMVGTLDTPGLASAVTVTGSLVAVADRGFGLRLIDVTNPAEPVARGLVASGAIRGVAIAGTTAFMTDEAHGLSVIDVSDPASPVVIGALDTPGWALAVSVRGGYACIADGPSGLHVVDISVPSAPQLLATVAGHATSVRIEDDLACVTAGASGLRVIDLSEPALPEVVGSMSLPGYAKDVALSGSRAFVAAYSCGLQEVDLSDPASPVRVRGIGTLGYASGVALTGQFACVAAAEGGLRIIDTTSPPPEEGILYLPGEGRAVEVSGTIACVGTNGGSDAPALWVVDVSDAASPQILGSASLLSDYIGCVAMSGEFAYVGWNGDFSRVLRVADISDPTQPHFVGGVLINNPNTNIHGVAPADGYAFVAAGQGGIVAVDVTNPSSPVVVGHLAPPASALDIAASGPYLYVADTYAGLVVVDRGNPSALQIVSSLDTPGASSGLAVRYGFAYLVGSLGLDVIDLSDPLSPQVTGRLADIGPCESVALRGDYAYVTSSTSGLHVIDVGDPALPRRIGGANAIQTPYDVATSAAGVWLADASGLRGLPLQCAGAGIDDHGRKVPGMALSLALAPVPSRGATTISFGLAREGPARLEVFDPTGRLLRRISLGLSRAGWHAVQWDGNTDDGRPLPSGSYLIRLEQAGTSASARIALVR